MKKCYLKIELKDAEIIEVDGDKGMKGKSHVEVRDMNDDMVAGFLVDAINEIADKFPHREKFLLKLHLYLRDII